MQAMQVYEIRLSRADAGGWITLSDRGSIWRHAGEDIRSFDYIIISGALRNATPGRNR